MVTRGCQSPEIKVVWLVRYIPSLLKQCNWPIGKPPPLVTVAPSDKQTELLTVLQWQLQCENHVPLCFCTILDTEGHQMGIKYSMEGFIKYLKINTVGNVKRGFTDHNASGRSYITVSYHDRRWQHVQLNECMTTRKFTFLSSFLSGVNTWEHSALFCLDSGNVINILYFNSGHRLNFF